MDTKDEVDAGEDIATDETIPASKADEEIVETEQDASSDEDNISYNGDITGKGSALLGDYTGVTYYSQMDSRWANIMYSSCNNKSQTIKSSGCGPTSAAMVVSSSKGAILPTSMAQLFVDNNKRTTDNGTAWSAWPFIADYFDFDEYYSTYYLDTAIKYLKTDKNKDGIADYFIVVSCGSGLFTSSGHYIVLIGYSGKIIVYDPYLYSGKFTTSSRRAAGVVVSGNVAYVTESAFRQYANYKCFWIYSNDSAEAVKQTASGTSTSTSVIYTRYVATQSQPLNVRYGAGTDYKIVGTLSKGTKVTVYETTGAWSRIGTDRWVSSSYLSASPTTTTTSTASSGTVVYVYIPATGRYAYCKKSAVSNGRLTYNTTLYSKSNLTGTKYQYLAKTKVTIKKIL